MVPICPSVSFPRWLPGIPASQVALSGDILICFEDDVAVMRKLVMLVTQLDIFTT